MAQPHPTLIIVGAGIVGLTLAVAAQARGHSVTLIARDASYDTASSVAAGMIAPALEALNDPEPQISYARLRAAQSAWFDLFDLWPDAVQQALRHAQSESRYVWPQDDTTAQTVAERLITMGVDFVPMASADVTPGYQGVRIHGDRLIDASTVLSALSAHTVTRRPAVDRLTATTMTLETGEVLTADAVVVAAGYASRALAKHVPCLQSLSPIKGHILDIVGHGGRGVIRSPTGYLANHGPMSKFGATMQVGQDDLALEPAQIAGLKDRAHQLLPTLDTRDAVARVGIRAASLDGWPMIGRDATSGVYVATAMRRNGYVFAPYAARLILDMLDGMTSDDAAAYDPNRFS